MSNDKSPLKRISLMLREDQHHSLGEKGLNLSGYIRDLIDDDLSDSKVTIRVSSETKELYDKVVSNTGSDDEAIESYLKESLRQLLQDKIGEMQTLVNKM